MPAWIERQEKSGDLRGASPAAYLGAQVERAVQTYVDALRGEALPAHRPGEPWLKKRVLLLARLLLARKQSRKGTERAIHGLFELAGHGDVATAEKIRHYIREERKRDPKFGAWPAAGLGAWFAKSDWRPTPSELGELRRSRRPRRQANNRRRVLRKKAKR